MSPEDQLQTISKAWGRQTGHCFFPWISGKANNREERIKSYNEGPAFFWPRDKAKIIAHMRAHDTDDLYWCPMLFEKPQRKMELAMDEHCLWADLDEVDPHLLDEYKPTIAWETSPGRYQALWLITGGHMGASWRGNENHRLTYYVGADPSGWDTTQLLRIPGNKNWKYNYRSNGDAPPQGSLLWRNGRRYLPDDFEDLPAVASAGQVEDILEGEVDNVDRHAVWGRVRLKVSKRVRELVAAREVAGDRSSVLWEIERELADAGCTVTEIVAIVRSTVWNKYSDRQDELKRLTIEASKAVELRTESTQAALETSLEADKPEPQNLFTLIENVKQPEWLVNQILSVGACGFIAGQPKQFKSWIALDLMLSVSTGLPFLDHFPVRKPGPVLYIQEEDSLPMVKSRIGKVWPSKQADKMTMSAGGELEWHPPDARSTPPINAVVRGGVTISDEGWQSWLDEKIAEGFEGVPYALVLIDPLMMVAGEVEETRSQEMTTKIFRPLKQLAEKHKCSVVVVHHMRKGDPSKPQTARGGQLMLGSVANHAWSEDSLYLKMGRKGVIVVERESKNTVSGSFTIQGLRNKQWTPAVVDDRTDEDDANDADTPPEAVETAKRSSPRRRNPSAQGPPRALDALRGLKGRASTKQIADVLGVTSSGAYRQLSRLEETGQITKDGSRWRITK